jgi:hypothetical protein
MAPTNQNLKELIAAITARGANVCTTEFEGAITSVQILGLTGVSSFPMTASAAAECMRGILAGEPQLELALV